jgi:hypothetical protein
MEYFGLTIDTESMPVKIPEKKNKELLKKLNEVEMTLSNLENCTVVSCSSMKSLKLFPGG